MSGPRPNVLLITSDHMRHDALGCYGNPFVRTPNYDRLAARGVRFVNGYTPNPVCVPARACITTGNYPHRCTGVTGNGGRIHDGQPRIAEVFNHAGYRTCALGKLHYEPYSPPGMPRLLHGFETAELTEEGRMLARFDPEGRVRGIEDYHDYLVDAGWGGYERAHGIGNNDVHPAPAPMPAEHYVDAWVATRTLAHLEAHLESQSGVPFFAWMSFTKPHPPYDPPEPCHRYYDPRALPAPHGGPADLESRNPVLRFVRGHHGLATLSPEAIQTARAYYHGMVTFQDEQAGRVLDFLEARGQLNNTIVVYTSDHGDLLGDFGCFFKGNFLEGACHVPFLISAPGLFPGGRTSDALVGLQDILPTVASLAGAPLDADVHGRDLAPVLRGEAAGVRDTFFGQHGGGPFLTHMVLSGGRKYIHTPANDTEEFYDLEHDPHELNNLAPVMDRSDLRPWRQRLVAWLRDEGCASCLEGDDLRAETVEIPDTIPFNAGSMGWRWY